MSLFPRASLALALILAAAAIGAASAGASGSSSAGVRAARACGSYRIGGVYIINLRAKGVKCRTAKRVANSFTKCRHRHGASGHCHHKVRHFKCKETRGQSSPAQYNSSVRCRRGGRRVKFDYTQNT